MCGGDEARRRDGDADLRGASNPPGEFGFVHAGEHGAGHFAKMVHNGMRVRDHAVLRRGLGAGWRRSSLVKNVPATFKSWREGTVIRSWLLDLIVRALDSDPRLDDRSAAMPRILGEGRWTVDAAIANAVPVPALTAATVRLASCPGRTSRRP